MLIKASFTTFMDGKLKIGRFALGLEIAQWPSTLFSAYYQLPNFFYCPTQVLYLWDMFLPWPFAWKAKPWSWCLLFHVGTSNFLTTFSQLSHNLLTTLSQFFTTFSQLSQNFLTTYSQLSHIFLATILLPSHNFHTTFSHLFENVHTIFSQPSHNCINIIQLSWRFATLLTDI